MLSVAEKTAQTAEHIAKHATHGYSQPDRDGYGTETIKFSDGTKATIHNGDYDCSEMDRVCVNAALSGNGERPIGYMWSGDADERLKEAGFTRMAFSASSVKRGDVLWCSGHMGIALGDGLQADAHGDEYGGIGYGASRGDQTGHEVEVRDLRSWTYIYRAPGDSAPQFYAATIPVTVAAECNIRSAPSMSTGAVVGHYSPGESFVADGVTFADGHVWATYLGSTSGKRRYVSLGNQHAWLVVP